MNRSYEKTLYLYTCALEDGDFERIAAILDAAAYDPALRALLFDLEAAHQADLRLPGAPVEEVPAMLHTSHSSNGRRTASPLAISIPARAVPGRGVAYWALRSAALLVIVVGALMIAWTASRTPGGVKTTDIASAPGLQGTPVPVTDRPVIGPDNADRLIQIRQYGEGASLAAIWGPDDSVAAYGYGIWLYAPETYELTRRIDTGTLIRDAAFSPDGTRLATANDDGSIRLFEIPGGAEILRLDAFDAGGHVAYSPDGQFIAASGAWGETEVRVWDADTGRQRLVLHGLRDSASNLAFSPDGSMLAASGLGEAYQDSTTTWQTSPQYVIDLWQIPTGDHIEKLVGSPQQVSAFAFSPDGEYLSATDWDSTLLTWLIANPDGEEQRESVRTWTAPESQPDFVSQSFAIDYSSDGAYLVTAHMDGQAYFWQATEAAHTFSVASYLNQPVLGSVDSAIYSPSGTRLLVGDVSGRVAIWDVTDMQQIVLLAALDDRSGNINSVALDGDRVAASGWNGGATIWDVDTGALKGRLEPAAIAGDLTNPLNATVYELVPDPGSQAWIGARVASGDGSLFRWDPDTDTVTRLDEAPFSARHRTLYDIALGPQGLVSGSSDGRVQVWQIDPPELLRELDLVNYTGILTGFPSVWRVAASPTSGVVAFIGNDDRQVHLWDSETDEELPPLSGNVDSMNALAFSPDGTLLAALDSSETLILWDTATWTEAARFEEVGGTEALAFSPDGALLAVVGTDGVALWDVEAQRQVGHPADAPGRSAALAFSADGTLLATGGEDGLVRLWAVP